MSAVLKAAKINRVNRAHPGVFARYHRGDPGLLGGIWNGIKGAVGGFLAGGPAGAIAGGAMGLIGGGAKKQQTQVMTHLAAGGAGVALTLPGAGLMGTPPWPTLPGRTQPSDGGIPGPVEWMRNQGVRGLAPEAEGGRCPAGYHPNKTGYYTRGGFVAAGTACVKNRKRNPLNPRAASRAMARLTSAKKATRSIAKFFGEGRRVSSGHSHFGKKKGCGCRK